jgi:hypothetical protein
MFLSMVTTDPNSPSQNIDIYLWLLIDELKQLWSSMTLTYNVSRKQNFQMKATLIWTINDFSVYGIIFGWSTHEKLACPYYMENNKTFTLTNIGKTSFFYCHWQFLSTDHKYRKKKTYLLVELKGMLHCRYRRVRNCLMWCHSSMTLYLDFKVVSKSFLVLVWSTIGKAKYFLEVFLLKN